MHYVLSNTLIGLIPINQCPYWADAAQRLVLRKHFEPYIRSYGRENSEARLKVWEDIWLELGETGLRLDGSKKQQVKNWYNRTAPVIAALQVVEEHFPITKLDAKAQTKAKTKAKDKGRVEREILVIVEDDDIAGGAYEATSPTGRRPMGHDLRSEGQAGRAGGISEGGRTNGEGSSRGKGTRIRKESWTVSLPDFDTEFTLPHWPADPPTLLMPKPTPFRITSFSGISSSVPIIEERATPGGGKVITFGGISPPIRPKTTSCELTSMGAMVKIFDGTNTAAMLVPLPPGHQEKDFTWKYDHRGHLIMTMVVPP
ncbi:hypothetical protein ONZ45_g10592 [Pleurotus djamor]|nr:hypothetical protein ONZ45_g10592 [Pleurotus djamor]